MCILLGLPLNIAVVQALFDVQSCARVWDPLKRALGRRIAHRLRYALKVFI